MVENFINNYKPKRIVETGTYLGQTTCWFAEHYPDIPVYSVEIHKPFFDFALEKCKKYPNITLQNTSSVDFLREADFWKEGLTFFWLDTHGGAGTPDSNPVQAECDIISKAERFICFIDDVFVPPNPLFGAVTQAPSMETICFYPMYPPNADSRGYVVYVKGIVISTPIQ